MPADQALIPLTARCPVCCSHGHTAPPMLWPGDIPGCGREAWAPSQDVTCVTWTCGRPAVGLSLGGGASKLAVLGPAPSPCPSSLTSQRLDSTLLTLLWPWFQMQWLSPCKCQMQRLSQSAFTFSWCLEKKNNAEADKGIVDLCMGH